MAEHNVTVESTLTALLAEKKYATIRDILITMNPSDIASIFDELEEEFGEMEEEVTETLARYVDGHPELFATIVG